LPTGGRREIRLRPGRAASDYADCPCRGGNVLRPSGRKSSRFGNSSAVNPQSRRMARSVPTRTSWFPCTGTDVPRPSG
jgi:hypothetical protein